MNNQFDSPRERSRSLASVEQPTSLSRGELTRSMAQSVTRRGALGKFGVGLTDVAKRMKRLLVIRLLLTLLPFVALPTLVQAQFTYETNNGKITITGYTGPGGVVSIPSTINGLPVTRVGNYAFQFQTNLTSVTIPDSVLNIGAVAFYYCSSLSHVAFGNGVTNIDAFAFQYCTSLTNVTIPDSVISIWEVAFSNCTNLTTVMIGDGVTLIEYLAFDGCTRLSNLTLGNNVRTIGYGTFRNCVSLSSVTIPDSVTELYYLAFQRCTGLTNVTIPSGVTALRDSVFSLCTSLVSVTIPDSVTRIEGSAFDGCTSLTQVTIPDSVTRIESGAFAGCSSLTNVAIGNGVSLIGRDVFQGCTNLTSIAVDPFNPVFSSVDGVLFDASQTTLLQYPLGKTGSYTIPDGVTSIGSGAFAGSAYLGWSNTGLTSVTIPDSVTNIEYYAFRYCSSLTNVTIGSGVASIGQWAFEFCTSLPQVTIPNGVTELANGQFWYCTSLTNVTIGRGVTNLSSWSAFQGCTNLAAITVDALNSTYRSVDGVLFNKNQTTLIQYPMGKAGDYTISTSVTTIGNSAFAACARLTAITVDALNASYSSVDGVLFNKDQTTLIQYPGGKIGSYTIPNSVTNIDGSAFQSCTKLTQVTIPNSVITIGISAFYNCTSLRNATIGNSVASIGGNAFDSCTSLVEVYFSGNMPSFVDSGAFFNSTNAIVYYLPGSEGWGQTLAGRPTALWKPQMQTTGDSFGVRTNQFGFNINWASGMAVVVEACTNLANPNWVSVATNTLTDGTSYFSDPQWKNYPARFYRLRSQ